MQNMWTRILNLQKVTQWTKAVETQNAKSRADPTLKKDPPESDEICGENFPSKDHLTEHIGKDELNQHYQEYLPDTVFFYIDVVLTFTMLRIIANILSKQCKC